MKNLSKEGIFIFRVPNRSCLDYHALKLFNRSEKWHGNTDKTHISLYTLRKWIEVSQRAGFKIKLLPYFPTRILKNFIGEKFPNLFFIPEFLYFTNKSITIFGIKK